MSPRWETLAAISGAAVLVLFASCGGNADDRRGNGSATPAQSLALLPIESIAAIGDYLGTTGLDGRPLDLTDPADCEAVQEEERAATTDQEREEIVAKVSGRLCINRAASLIRGDQAVVTLREYFSGAGWLLRMEQTDGVWTVLNVEPVGGIEP